MKVTRPREGEVVLHMGLREKEMLVTTLSLYPVIPAGSCALTKGGGIPDQENSQKLLEEALEEQRRHNKQQLDELMTNPLKVVQNAKGAQMRLSLREVEWLLQVLNDIRVGSWVKLGSPEEKIHRITTRTARDVFVMEVAGFYEMTLLEALSGS